MKIGPPLAIGLLLIATASVVVPPRDAFLAQRQEMDLRYLERRLSHHPMLTDSAKLAAFRTFANGIVRQASRPLPSWRLLELAGRMANWFHDPHTAVGMDAAALHASYIPVGFYWAPDGLVVFRAPGAPVEVATGDRVLSISGMSTATLRRRLGHIYPGNPYWKRSLYVTENLSASPLLEMLGLVGSGGRVTLRLRRPDGATYTASLPLIPAEFEAQEMGAATSRFLHHYYLPQAKLVEGRFWAYEVTPDYGYFVLTQCIDSPAYENAVAEFFRKVHKAHAPDIVLDLRLNFGGDSRVMNAWLQHLPLAYALAAYMDVGQASPQFHGRLYVLTSWNTFSSATMMTLALTGPGLGVRVGQPIGESTAGYGNVVRYETPNLHIMFQVPERYFPPLKGPVRMTLRPEIPMPLTARDVQRGVNPLLRWLQSLPAAPTRN